MDTNNYVEDTTWLGIKRQKTAMWGVVLQAQFLREQ